MRHRKAAAMRWRGQVSVLRRAWLSAQWRRTQDEAEPANYAAVLARVWWSVACAPSQQRVRPHPALAQLALRQSATTPVAASNP